MPIAPRPPRGPLKALLRHLALATLLVLAACGALEKDPTSKWDADRLYNEARSEMHNSNWSKARELLEKLEARYPFGRYAQQAQIEIAYCYYKEGEVADTIATTERFLKLNPTNPDTDYVYYLRGLANFIEPPAYIGALIGYRVSERDPKALRDSYDAFKQLLTRYPQSRYAADARLRFQFLRDALADHEIHVADYYYRRSAFLAAIGRAQTAIRDYPDSPRLEHALGIMARCYAHMGMEDLRESTERVLRANFPDSKETQGL